MFKVKGIKAREILDSRGNPTVEADLELIDGNMGRFAVPSGVSVGMNEALELRDKDERYHGKGVLKAVYYLNTIVNDTIVGKTFSSQERFDEYIIKLDNTSNKSKLGANVLLAASGAFAKAKAESQNLPLFISLSQNIRNMNIPVPMFNIINGGQHADNKLDFQEFMIIPFAENISERLRIASEVFYCLRQLLIKHGFNVNVGDEGGFAPNISSSHECLDYLCEAIHKAGYTSHVKLAVDAAATTFFEEGQYKLRGEDKTLSTNEMVNYYAQLVRSYPIISIEDPIAEQDIEGWKEMTSTLGECIQIVGDDIFVTNKEFLLQGIKEGIANSILIKMNQVGTITETIEAIQVANQNKYSHIISHRSGETEDTTISHLSVAMNSSYIKAGSICRGERVCKYNELVRISQQIDEMR